MKEVKESVFDVMLRKMRLRRVLPSIRQFNNPRLLDVGCGWEARLLHEVEPYIAKGVGIDFKAPEIKTDKIHTFSYFLEPKGMDYYENLSQTPIDNLNTSLRGEALLEISLNTEFAMGGGIMSLKAKNIVLLQTRILKLITKPNLAFLYHLKTKVSRLLQC